MKCGTATFQIRMQIFSQVFYKSVRFFYFNASSFLHMEFFLDNTPKSYFDMGKEDAERYYFAADGGDLDYYFYCRRDNA